MHLDTLIYTTLFIFTVTAIIWSIIGCHLIYYITKILVKWRKHIYGKEEKEI